MIVNNIQSSNSCPDDCDTIYSTLEGYVDLTVAQTTVTVTFPAQPSEYAIQYLYFVNTVDADPLKGIGWTVTAQSLTGFTVKLDASPLTLNYRMRWKLATVRIQI